MGWLRFPVPEFDHRALKGLEFSPPPVLSREDEQKLLAACEAGDASVAGAYGVEPDAALLERLSLRGDHRQMMLCALPSRNATLVGRSMAWFNQRAHVLDRNHPDAKILHQWRTPRTHNTRLGPEDGVTIEMPVVYLLSGRILEDHDRGNRMMIDPNWQPPNGHAGYRVICGCDKGGDTFHDSCFMFSWPREQ